MTKSLKKCAEYVIHSRKKVILLICLLIGCLHSTISQAQSSNPLAQIAMINNDYGITFAQGAYINGNYLYTLNGKYGVCKIETYDISNPGSPVKTDSQTLTDRDGIAMLGDNNKLYVTGYNNHHLSIFDLSNGSKPILQSTTKQIVANGDTHEFKSNNLSKIGNKLFLTAGWDGVISLDVSNPQSISFLGLRTTSGSGFAGAIQVGNDVVIFDDYVAYYCLGTALAKNGTLEIPGDPADVRLYDNSRAIVYSSGTFNTYINVLDVPGRNILKSFDVTKDVSIGGSEKVTTIGTDLLIVKGLAVFATYNISDWTKGNFTTLPLITTTPLNLQGGDCLYAKDDLLIVGDGDDFRIYKRGAAAIAPVATLATNANSTGFTANWNAVAGVTNYQLDVSSTDFQTFVTGYNSKSVTGTSIAVSGLSPNTSYKYRVRAMTGTVASASSNVIQITTLVEIPGTPPAPVTTGATNLKQNGFTANWNSSLGANSYQLDVSADNFASFVTGYNSKSTKALSEEVTGLASGKTYQYRVRGVNGPLVSLNSNPVEVILISRSPSISAFSPVTGAVLTSVTITGTNFSEVPSNNAVKFNGIAAEVIESTATSLIVKVPAGATTGPITVTVDGQTATSTTAFTVVVIPAPSIVSVNPTAGNIGTTVVIAGNNFSTTPESNIVKFNGVAATVSTSTSTSIFTVVPGGATSGSITVTVGNQTATSPSVFEVSTTPVPTITDFTPASGSIGTIVTITGSNFKTTAAENTIKFNGVTATVTASTATSITATVPAGATTGKITVTVNGITVTTITNFTVLSCEKPPQPKITILNNNTATPTLSSSASAGNQWYLNGFPINGETGNTLLIKSAGTYKVQVKVAICLSDFSADFPVVITGDSGSHASAIITYPNPAEKYLEISGLALVTGKTQLYDYTGRSYFISFSGENKIFRADVSHLNSGFYLLRLQDETTSHLIKFIKK